MYSADLGFILQDNKNGQITVEHLTDENVTHQNRSQESNSTLILEPEPRYRVNDTNTFEENTFEENPKFRPLPHDIIVSIKDENSRSRYTMLRFFTHQLVKCLLKKESETLGLLQKYISQKKSQNQEDPSILAYSAGQKKRYKYCFMKLKFQLQIG